MTPVSAWIGLGSNLGFPPGDRLGAIRWAVDSLDRRPEVSVRARSAIRDTAPEGPEQPRYLNAVVEVATTLAPSALLAVCLTLEAAAGRDRESEVRFGPRSLDLDILLFGSAGDAVVQTPGLAVPHPRLAERRFVLEPLAELCPDLVHPVLGRTIRSLLDALPERDPAERG